MQGFNQFIFYCFAVFIALSYGCTNNTGGNEGVRLVYPYDYVDYGSIDHVRELAKSVAPYYVKVSIFDLSYQTGNRSTDHGSLLISGASGTVVDASGYVVTAAHIAKDARYSARITTVDGATHDADIVNIDPAGELALLRIVGPYSMPGPPFLLVSPRPGQPVFAIGTPSSRSGIVTVGSIREVRLQKKFQYDEFGFNNPIMLSMHVEPGYSGGPVFDDSGRLVGMIVGFDMRKSVNGGLVPTGDAYAIPAMRIRRFLETFKSSVI